MIRILGPTPKRLLIALITFFAPTYSLVGQEREFTNYNCAITPPDGWSMMTNYPSQPGLFTIFFGKADKSRLVLLMVDDRHKPAGPVDDRFVAEFEGGVERGGGGKRISGRFTEIDGIKGYERLGYAMVREQAKTNTGFEGVNITF